jgi:DNA invertase Pin-like site-specific DNA recombinase
MDRRCVTASAFALGGSQFRGAASCGGDVHEKEAELLSIEADLTKRGIGLVVLSMGGERLDTRKPTSKLMLTILAGVATWEREIMLERQREGIAKAKAAGKYKGRPISIDARRSSN